MYFKSAADLEDYITKSVAEPYMTTTTTTTTTTAGGGGGGGGGNSSRGLMGIGAAVVFTGGGPDYAYEVRMNPITNNGRSYMLPPSKMTIDTVLKMANTSSVSCGGKCWGSYSDMYSQSGALALMNAVDSYLIGLTTTTHHPVILDTESWEFPSPSYYTTPPSGFWGTFQSFYIWVIILCVLIPANNALRAIVLEKGE